MQWQSDSRKEVLAAEAARLKEYERVAIEEARIKSEQLRTAREARRLADKATKREVEQWQSDSRKEGLAAEAAPLEE